MAKYVAIAPDGLSVTLSSNYGTRTFTQGEVIFNDSLAAAFPTIFKKVDESTLEKIVIEPAMDIKETVQEVAAVVMDKVSDIIDDIKESFQADEPVQEEVQPESVKEQKQNKKK